MSRGVYVCSRDIYDLDLQGDSLFFVCAMMKINITTI